jgi:membrane protein
MRKAMERALKVPALRFAYDMVDVYFSKRVSRAAAELAYFLILTFFPILICVSAFVGRLNLDLAELLEDADKLLPGGVNAILDDYFLYLETSQTRGMLLVGVFMTVLFASAAVRSLMNIMREIYGRATFRGLSQLVASVLFSLFLLFAIYLSLAVVVTGNWFFHLIEQLFGLEDLTERFGTWQWLKYLILLGVVFLFILLLYRFTAPLTRPRPPVMIGAFAAAVALAAASVIFSWFMSRSTRYSLVYGSLASVVILLVWLYLCGNILILGNVANFVLYRHRKGSFS